MKTSMFSSDSEKDDIDAACGQYGGKQAGYTRFSRSINKWQRTINLALIYLMLIRYLKAC